MLNAPYPNFSKKSNLMRRHLSRTFLLSLQAAIFSFFLSSGYLKSQTLSLNQNLIDFNSPQGEQLLTQSQARQDYFPLSIQFVTQDNLAYCGVASMVMVLNALNIPAPQVPELRTNRFTQENFFNPETEQILPAKVVARRGMTLTQLAQLISTYPVQAEVYHGGEVTLDQFRTLVSQNLQQGNNFVLVNYLRRTIGQQRGGHISPIAAYHQGTDRFLILDVSRYKYPPVWVKAEELWQAMATVDTSSGKTRGFVLISPN